MSPAGRVTVPHVSSSCQDPAQNIRSHLPNIQCAGRVLTPYASAMRSSNPFTGSSPQPKVDFPEGYHVEVDCNDELPIGLKLVQWRNLGEPRGAEEFLATTYVG
ncbi:hypothetical protein RRF57_011292 [Xylaria bambusicola]|uniref:Uncharacterized protein n=1 Tax=Xylaria bambusicola TaxID=326684 RepID=A0AAN7UMJ7_9PEZI